MAQQVFPTKSNLMATKRSLALAAQGYDLMVSGLVPLMAATSVGAGM